METNSHKCAPNNREHGRGRRHNLYRPHHGWIRGRALCFAFTQAIWVGCQYKGIFLSFSFFVKETCSNAKSPMPGKRPGTAHHFAFIGLRPIVFDRTAFSSRPWEGRTAARRFLRMMIPLLSFHQLFSETTKLVRHSLHFFFGFLDLSIRMMFTAFNDDDTPGCTG
jgi:hypothetical protein